ncbi:MAG: hypothetical protein WKF81_00805 [Thermomicrobiales bacterium]
MNEPVTSTVRDRLHTIFRESDFSARTDPDRGKEAWVVWFDRVHYAATIAAGLLFLLAIVADPRDPVRLAVVAGLLVGLGFWTYRCLFQDRRITEGNQFESG